MMLTAPKRLTAKTCCQASGVDVSTLLLPGPLMPALLNLRAEAAGGLDWIGTRQRTVVRRLQLTGVGAGMGGGGGREEG